MGDAGKQGNYAGGLSRQGVNFRGGTLSTKQRVWSAWGNGGTLRIPPRHLAALSGNASSSRKRGKNAKSAPPRRLTPGAGFFAEEQSGPRIGFEPSTRKLTGAR